MGEEPLEVLEEMTSSRPSRRLPGALHTRAGGDLHGGNAQEQEEPFTAGTNEQ
jgi:hypothetical protein